MSLCNDAGRPLRAARQPRHRQPESLGGQVAARMNDGAATRPPARGKAAGRRTRVTPRGRCRAARSRRWTDWRAGDAAPPKAGCSIRCRGRSWTNPCAIIDGNLANERIVSPDERWWQTTMTLVMPHCVEHRPMSTGTRPTPCRQRPNPCAGAAAARHRSTVRPFCTPVGAGRAAPPRRFSRRFSPPRAGGTRP